MAAITEPSLNLGILQFSTMAETTADQFQFIEIEDRLLAEQEFDEYQSKISPLSPDGRKRYGINARNETYRPGGGNVKIFSEKIDFKSVGPRIDARSKSPRKSPPSSIQSPVRQISRSAPGNSSPSPNTKQIRSKVGSLDNARHTPGGGNVKIINRKEKYDAVQSKIGSKDNITHKPGGGNIKIENKRLSFLETAKPKVGSLDKVDHKPGGGDKKITDEKIEWECRAKIGSKDNLTYKPGGGDKKILDEKVEWSAQPKVGSKDNITHKPGGGDKKIEEQKLEWKVEAKVGSKDNLKHSPGGGVIKIDSQITEEKEVKSDIESVGSDDHQAVGGITTPSPPPSQVESQRLNFTENADLCTDTGVDKS